MSRTKLLISQVVLQKKSLNKSVVRIYVRLLCAKGKYKEAIRSPETLNNVKPNVPLLLQECRLKDRIFHRDKKCYKRALLLSEQKGRKDPDYLMVLFLSDDKRFESKRLFTQA